MMCGEVDVPVETIFTNLQLKVTLIKDMGRKYLMVSAKIFEDVWIQKYLKMIE